MQDINCFNQLIILGNNQQIIKIQNIIQMQKQNWEEEIKKLVAQLDFQIEGYQNGSLPKDQQKKIKKKFKKHLVDDKDSSEVAIEKTKKLLEDVYKSYQAAVKQEAKTSHLKQAVDISKAQKQKSMTQVKMVENLQKGFMKKYEQSLANAKDVEKQEQEKRKKLIEDLQEKIKVVQQQYQAAGKVKIEKIKENQILKHEISKIQPQIVTTESLYDAQLKKKQIQVEIQMTTLKQKIEMMSNFKNIGNETKQKMEKAEGLRQKIQSRVQVLDKKEEQHKILLTKAHLILEDYKKGIIKINEILKKKEKQALQGEQKTVKTTQAIKDIDAKLAGFDKQEQAQKNNIKMLLKLEEDLKKQLQQ